MIVSARRANSSISETSGLLGFSRTTVREGMRQKEWQISLAAQTFGKHTEHLRNHVTKLNKKKKLNY